MSKSRTAKCFMQNMSILRRFFLVVMDEVAGAMRPEIGGADRDRTDDLKLAKLALSQLSYGPEVQPSLAR